MFPTISEVLANIEGEERPMPAKTTRFNVDIATMPPINEEQVHESMRGITEEQALDRLEKMLEMDGMLQIITDECSLGPSCVTNELDPATGKLVRTHDESQYPTTDHHHFVKHDVVAIDQDERGRIRAHSDEGDWTVSPSGARSLLRHLTRVSLGSG